MHYIIYQLFYIIDKKLMKLDKFKMDKNITNKQLFLQKSSFKNQKLFCFFGFLLHALRKTYEEIEKRSQMGDDDQFI